MHLQQLRAFKPQILAIAERYGVSNIRVFGSVARDEADETSDVDLMIDMAPGKSLFDLVEFKHKLHMLLDREVDVVQIEAVKNPLRRRYMLQDVTPL